MKTLCKFLSIVVLLFTSMTSMAVSPHFFHRMDVTTGNLYSFVASNLISAGINKITQDRFLDTSFGYTYNKITTDGRSSHAGDYNRVGIQARDLFADSSVGLKLGWQSFNFSWFNWGVFASGHFRNNQFKWDYNDASHGIRIQRLQPGGGIMLSFGDMESSTRVIVEASLKYNIPVGCKGVWGDEPSDVLNKGWSSHYTLRIAGSSALQGIGLFAEIPHYNLVRTTALAPVDIKLSSYTFGITYTICPWDEKL